MESHHMVKTEGDILVRRRMHEQLKHATKYMILLIDKLAYNGHGNIDYEPKHSNNNNIIYVIFSID
jgi:hypothetical protein